MVAGPCQWSGVAFQTASTRAIVEHAAEIFDGGRRGAAVLFGRGGGGGQPLFVDVADVGNADLLILRQQVEMRRAHSAGADDADDESLGVSAAAPPMRRARARPRRPFVRRS